MKFFNLFAPIIALTLCAFLSFGNSMDASQLQGGSFQGQTTTQGGQTSQEEAEPKPTKYKCERFCEDAGNCTTNVCAFDGSSLCQSAVGSFSGKCKSAANGPLEECSTGASNDFCFKSYQNPCTEERPVCTQYISGCGTQYQCN